LSLPAEREHDREQKQRREHELQTNLPRNQIVEAALATGCNPPTDAVHSTLCQYINVPSVKQHVDGITQLETHYFVVVVGVGSALAGAVVACGVGAFEFFHSLSCGRRSG
jgi:hypothetical protein